MAKISRADGPSYAGVIPDVPPTTEEYEDAQKRVAQGKPEDGDGALIQRYDSAAARRVGDPHAEPAEIGERASGDASLKATEGGDASLEYSDPETGQPRLTDEGKAFLSGERSGDQGDGDGSDDSIERDESGDRKSGEQVETERREQRQEINVPEQTGPAAKSAPRSRR